MRRRILAGVLLATLVLSMLSVGVSYALDPWSGWKIMQDYPSFGAGAPGFFGSPRSGPGYNSFGYNYFNPWAGPPMPPNALVGTLGFYNPYAGPGGVGDGWDGYAYGFYVPGATTSYGLYGLGIPSGYRLYGGWN